MITIADILRVRHVDLDLNPANQEEAVLQVATSLKNDNRITDWAAFYSGLKSAKACVAGSEDFELLIPHIRSDAVNEMVMSMGRSNFGMAKPGEEPKAHYIFVIGVPLALAADYLRIIGALARIFRDPEAEKQLRGSRTPEEFLEILSTQEFAI